MKRFLIHFSLLVCVLFVTLFSLEFVYNQVFRNGIARNKRQTLLKYSNQNHDIIMLGSSRTESHINDTLFEELTRVDIVNAGIERASLQDAYVVTHRLLKNNVSFKELWIQLDYTYNIARNSRNFFAELIPYQNDTEIYTHLIETGAKNRYEVPFYDYMNNEKAVGFREFFMQLIKKPSKNDISLSSASYNGTGTYTAGEWPNALIPNLGVEKIIELSVEHDFKVIFFTTPNCPKNVMRNSYMELMKAKYEFVDYTRLFDNQLQYYRDCGHLNTSGQEFFTRQLASDYIKSKR